MRTFKVIALIALFFIACNPDNGEFPAESQTALIPIYLRAEQVKKIEYQSPKPIQDAGKQYVFGNLLLQNEVNEGIHFFNISDPSNPVKSGFLQIPLCTEMAIKGGFLYANNLSDLVVFDLSSGTPQLKKRIENVFPPVNQQYPPFLNVAFECPDPAKGIVVGWEQKNNIRANCRR